MAKNYIRHSFIITKYNIKMAIIKKRVEIITTVAVEIDVPRTHHYYEGYEETETHVYGCAKTQEEERNDKDEIIVPEVWERVKGAEFEKSIVQAINKY